MCKTDLEMGRKVFLNRLPIAVVIPDLSAPRADWNDFLKHSHLLKRFLQLLDEGFLSEFGAVFVQGYLNGDMKFAIFKWFENVAVGSGAQSMAERGHVGIACEHHHGELEFFPQDFGGGGSAYVSSEHDIHQH